MNGRGRVALVALAILVVFMLALVLKETERRRRAEARTVAVLTEQAEIIRELRTTQDGIVRKLTEVFATPGIDTQRVIDSVKGFVDPKLIEEAVRRATIPGPRGQTGATGPTGPAGQNAVATTTTTITTTTTRQAVTTTTTRPPPSTTTTTRPCLLSVPGVARIGC